MLLSGLVALTTAPVLAEDQPRGQFLELHSCELYAGGCIVSSEATLGGRYMLRAWDFSGGAYRGTDLAGLQLAVLQFSSQNLASPEAEPGQAVVYLPEAATASQRAALLGWLKSNQAELDAKHLQTRVVPLRFTKNPSGYSFAAGSIISVETAPLEACQTGGCGEALWYTPRTASTLFTVAVDRASQVNEPLLKLKWTDAGKRNVFLARFGGEAPGNGLYVSTAELCGAF
jgi:hypothetical protein